MGAPTVSVRCPACGAELHAVLAPSPPTQWFPCPQCRNPVPVVVPRDLPPLYTWEVAPELYPALPPPRRPRVSLRRMAQVALVGVAVLAVVFGGVLAVLGYEALGPGSYTVSGTVVLEWTTRGYVPNFTPTVVLTTDSGATFLIHTGTDGKFLFSNVPAGGITLNVSCPGFGAATLVTFASPVYDAGTTDLSVSLHQGSSNTTTIALSPFPDLETFVASIGSGVALLGLVAVLGGAAAVITRRSDRPAVGVVGGAAALLSPVALYLLSLGGIFPLLTTGTAVLAAVGAFVATIRSVEMYQVGSASRPY